MVVFFCQWAISLPQNQIMGQNEREDDKWDKTKLKFPLFSDTFVRNGWSVHLCGGENVFEFEYWPGNNGDSEKLSRLVFYFRFSSLLPANDYLSSLSDTRFQCRRAESSVCSHSECEGNAECVKRVHIVCSSSSSCSYAHCSLRIGAFDWYLSSDHLYCVDIVAFMPFWLCERVSEWTSKWTSKRDREREKRPSQTRKKNSQKYNGNEWRKTIRRHLNKMCSQIGMPRQSSMLLLYITLDLTAIIFVIWFQQRHSSMSYKMYDGRCYLFVFRFSFSFSFLWPFSFSHNTTMMYWCQSCFDLTETATTFTPCLCHCQCQRPNAK